MSLCVSQVAYTQNAFIPLCGSEFGDDPHCGVFLEIHIRDGSCALLACCLVWSPGSGWTWPVTVSGTAIAHPCAYPSRSVTLHFIQYNTTQHRNPLLQRDWHHQWGESNHCSGVWLHDHQLGPHVARRSRPSALLIHWGLRACGIHRVYHAHGTHLLLSRVLQFSV
mgnify:CR=1 FL=1